MVRQSQCLRQRQTLVRCLLLRVPLVCPTFRSSCPHRRCSLSRTGAGQPAEIRPALALLARKALASSARPTADRRDTIMSTRSPSSPPPACSHLSLPQRATPWVPTITATCRVTAGSHTSRAHLTRRWGIMERQGGGPNDAKR